MEHNSIRSYHIGEFNHYILIAGIPLGIQNITHGNHKHYTTNHGGHIKREKYDLQTKI